MADVGTLVVRMAADSAQMRSELDRVQKQLKATSSSTVDLAGSFKGLAALAGGFSMVAVVTQALQAAEALQNVSIQTGISTDALQRLEFAAGLSGASLDQVSGAVTKLQKALVTSGEGSKEAQAALERLGVSSSELIALAPDKQFERIAVAISSISDPAQRATAAVALFGRSGAELLPTLTAVGANAAEINAQFSELGGPVSAQALGAVDQLGDSLDALKAAGKSLGVELVALAAGPLTTVLNVTNEWLGSLRILAGGGGEIERLQRQLEILQESRDSIPVFFNFGYVDGADVVLGPKAIEAAMTRLRAQIDELKRASNAADAERAAKAAAAAKATTPAATATPAAKPAKGAGGKPDLTPEERRVEAERNMRATLGAEALAGYQAQEFALDQHLVNMVALESQAALARVKIASDMEMFRADVAQAFGLQQLDFEAVKNQSIIGLAGELFTALGSESSKLFKVQKAFAIANAVVNVAEGITQALKLPFPANLAAAAKVAAFGAIQVAKIKATNPGGGSSAPSLGGSGGGGATSAAMPDQMPAMQQQEPQRISQVIVQGNLFSTRETADWLIEQLSDAVNNRDVVFINGASRQAGAIAEAA